MTAHAKNRHGNEQAVVDGAKEESHDLTTLHTALRQEQCAHNCTYSTSTGAMCSQCYIQHCDRSNVLTTVHTALRQEQCAHNFTYSTATGAMCCCKESLAGANESGDSKKQKTEGSDQRNRLDTPK